MRVGKSRKATFRAALAAFCAGVAPAARASAATAPAPPKPNIIQILVDDLGWGDVGFNGQTKIKTPNLNALAAGGTVMVNGYCPASVCAPTRASLLTGFHSGHTFVDRNAGGGDLAIGWRSEDVTIAEVLRPAGYATAAIGKWGFGGSESGTDAVILPNSLPNKQGYDSFYGYLAHSRAQDYFSPTLWRTNASAANGVESVATNGVFTHDLFEQQALQYVADHGAAQQQPFYLHFAPTIPHFDLDAIASVPNWDSEYRGAAYASWTDKQKKYAAMVTRMDATIGRLMARLDDPNGDGSTADSIAASTMVVFTSDNGPSWEDGAPYAFFDSNGPFRGGKIDLQEGGIRTPLVVRWKNHIAAGAVNGRVTDLSDFLPTFAELAGAETPVGVDGVSIAPSLTGGGVQRPRDYQIFEGHETTGGIASMGGPASRWAIRRGDYKLIKFDDGSFELYDLAHDPFELMNIVGSNAALKIQLESIALAEQVEQPTEYAVTYRTWIGGDNASVTTKGNWVGNESPAANWSAVVENASGATRVANVNSNVEFLGFGVRGLSGKQVVNVASNVTLTGRNEIRISAGGEIDLLGGNLNTVRWVEVRSGGVLVGRGHVNGSIYNDGLVSASGGTLYLHGGGAHSGTFNVEAGATLDFAGGAHVINAGATFTGTGGVRMSGTATVTVAQGAHGTLRVETLAIDPTAKLDLKDNNLVIGTATAAAVEQMIAIRRIDTTTPAATAGLTGLGVATAGQCAYGNFCGISVAADDILVMYTYAGDANLDGFISGDDYSAIDFNAAIGGAKSWFKGDFNHDGVVSGDDYAAIDFNTVAQGAPFVASGATTTALTIAVPETAMGITLSFVAASMCARHRRRGRFRD